MRKVALLLVLLFAVMSAHAQQSLVDLQVSAGFDGRFRENMWMPLLVNITNNGDPINGRLVVRPERADALTNAFSTPVTLASGARQSVFLYITMRSFGSTLRVELFNEQNMLVTENEVGVRHVSPQDHLHLVLTSATSSAVNFDGVSPSGDQAVQVNWFTNNIPDKYPALKAINTIVFTDVDSGTLTPGQREAIDEWVTAGGHLIVTGGPNWQPTAAGLTDLLPLVPNTSNPVGGLETLAHFGGDYEADFSDEAIVATGTLTDDAQVLVASTDGTPLIARRVQGHGTVDYLALDPSIEPLRSWDNLRNVWFTLTTSVAPRPGWTHGFSYMEPANTAMEVLPGYSALPEVMSMLSFLAAYIVLIGPVNYLVLNRLNRRELAWVTIPILILVFSVLAWVTGFNLRGNEVILSRLSVVQSWADSENAQVEQLIGLLAPRRANYNLVMDDDRMMRPVLRPDSTGSLFRANASNIDIEQTDSFAAQEFGVDASFVAGFSTNGLVEKPDIGGRLTISFSEDGNMMTARGSIRNNTEQTIFNPVILARGVALSLGEPIEPGEQRLLPDAGLVLSGEQLAAPSPVEYIPGTIETGRSSYYYGSQGTFIPAERSIMDVLGQENFNQVYAGMPMSTRELNLDIFRRQLFMNTFMIDQYASTARGNKIYLAGWTNTAPFEDNIGGAASRSVDTTLYLVELDAEMVKPIHRVLITADQFTWTTIESADFAEISPSNTMIYNNTTVAFRFTPQPEALLSQVDGLYIILQASGGSTNSTTINFWNWEEQEWEPVQLSAGRQQIPGGEKFVGPQNAVQLQIVRDQAAGTYFLERIAVEQRGLF